MSLLYYYEARLRKFENILPEVVCIFLDTDHSHLKKQMEGALQPLTPLYNILMCTRSA